MATLNHLDMWKDIQDQSKRIGFDENPEIIYSQMLTVPFGPTEDGSRALIAGHQYLQLIPLSYPETPIIGTGFENSFGDRSNSIIQAEEDYEVLGKISKFSKHPDQHYFLIVKKKDSNEIDYIERMFCKHTTESYGIVYDNSVIDSVQPGDTIKEGAILRKSNVYDQYMNRCDGTNMRTVYLCMDENTEDAIRVSKTGRRKLTSPLVHHVQVMKNGNDIFLNTMGTNGEYKCFPDIGEKIKDGILLASRKTVIKEALYMQSIEHLSQIMMSDEKFTISGNCTVQDINIYVNNPAKLSQEFYDSQLLYYYNENMRFINEFVDLVEPYIGKANVSYRLEKMYHTFIRVLNGDQYIKEKKFSDLMIEFLIVEEHPLEPGDKIADRFGATEQ